LRAEARVIIDFAVDRGVALITMNHPKRMNALDAWHLVRLRQGLALAPSRELTRLPVLPGIHALLSNLGNE
jgi:enoyl-CoA hydratase/carnithine racemase